MFEARYRKRRTAVLWLAVAALLVGCDGGGGPAEDVANALDPDVPPITGGTWYRPVPTVSWQWQLNGTLNTGYDVAIYDVDLFDVPEAAFSALHESDVKVVCYFSAGTYEAFRPDAGAFEPADLGKPLDDYPDERWLDVRSSSVHAVVKERLDLAVEKGCDGVEPDNVDGFANDAGFDLTPTDQLAFNRFVANEAHQRGLSVGLKNDLDQIDALVAYFDFALNEQCHAYDECEVLSPFVDAGKAVLNAEYDQEFVTNRSARDALCRDALARRFSTLILPVELDDRFRIACGE